MSHWSSLEITLGQPIQKYSVTKALKEFFKNRPNVEYNRFIVTHSIDSLEQQTSVSLAICETGVRAAQIFQDIHDELKIHAKWIQTEASVEFE